jgi:hypothetical protein
MSPRRTNIAQSLSVSSDPIHDVLDATPAEISPGVYLPATRIRATARFGSFTIALVVSIKDRQPICEEMTISRGGSPVTASALREIPVASIIEMTMLGVFGRPFKYKGATRVPITAQTVVEARSERLPRRVLMPRVVEAYRAAMADPSTRSKPILTVAEKLGGYQPAYISKLVSEARKEGLLGAAAVGRPGELNSKEGMHHD